MQMEPSALDAVDRKILNVIQNNFPAVQRPYREIGALVGIGEQEVIERIGRMRKEGVIRSVRALYDAKKLHYVSALVACSVDEDQLDHVAGQINAWTEITHNYQRDFQYNLWFTIIARDVERREMILDKIRGLEGVRALHLLPIEKKYKLKVHFQMSED